MKKLIAILLLFTLVSGCTEPQSTITAPATECGIYDINVHEAKALVDTGEMFIIDVRTVQEYEAGHLINSTLIPVSEISERLDEIPKDEPLLVYCRSGRRSTTAAGILEENGFCVIYDVDGGFNDWVAAGYPYE
ncbi:rhodanese-related sulfurtransferase [Methanohalophilus levihalophilus]|uniref:rhodanese-like domain-containing protein n=1 Tax=Methanohalophilus levihalophilus TaxID=1431282 RepID=UPI001AE4A753|nr:rhodanese-like domain-containing protein [Methanohalophilus levihalophilus]MBP2030009.1 rhodanese-related sulfurtransferase [Methanohalophilus levihalophilus]